MHPRYFQWTYWLTAPEKRGLNRIQIHERGQGFSVSQRVEGSQDGREFMIEVRRKYLPFVEARLRHYTERFGEVNLSWLKWDVFEALRGAAQAQGDTETVGRMNALASQVQAWEPNAFLLDFLALTRQFASDTSPHQWALVDWD